MNPCKKHALQELILIVTPFEIICRCMIAGPVGLSYPIRRSPYVHIPYDDPLSLGYDPGGSSELASETRKKNPTRAELQLSHACMHLAAVSERGSGAKKCP